MRRALLPLALALLAPASAAMQQTLSFDGFLRDVAAAPDSARAGLVDGFVEAVRAAGAPLVEDDSTVVFVHRSDRDEVRLLGDMTYGGDPVPMTRVPGTDLFYHRATFEPDARLEYRFLGPEGDPFGVPDPLNPHRVLSGIGPFSELAMPGYAYPEVFASVRDGTAGGYERVAAHELPPGALPYPHEVHVYTPPGYDEAATYPVLYLQDGRDYIEFAHVPAVLDALIATGEIEPVLAVFVTPPNRFQPEAPNRTTEYGLNDAYVAFFADELVPFVQARYRARPEPSARLVAGDSYGGLISTYIAFERPDVFGLAHSQSGYHSFQDDRLIRLVAAEPARPIRLYVDVGTYETSVGAGWLPDAETDFLAANRRLRAALEAKGYDVVYREYPEGHTWGTWRAHLIDSLTHFFGRSRPSPSEG